MQRIRTHGRNLLDIAWFLALTLTGLVIILLDVKTGLAALLGFLFS